jgi:hypothetical protein
MATAIFCRREHLHGSAQKVLAATSVSIVSKKDPQAMPRGQGVCVPSMGRARRQRYTLLSLPLRSTSCIGRQILVSSEKARPKKLYTSNQIHWCFCHSSLATGNAGNL